MHKKFHGIAVFIEFVAGSGLAIFFHLVLHQAETAYVVFGVGILLSLATYLLREDLEQTREKIFERYDHAHEFAFVMVDIKDPDGQVKAQEVIASAKRTLKLLQQGYVPLDETEFYLKGTKYMDESRARIKSVDPIGAGCEVRGAIFNYYQANLRARERGVQISRIFVLSREELTDAEVQKVLSQQQTDGIEVRIAYRDELPSANEISGRDTASSFNFTIYDDQVATEVFSLTGKYFGCKTRETGLVANYLRLFDLIEHGSYAFVDDSECTDLAVLKLREAR